MTRGTWAVIIVVLLAIVVGAGVVYRAPLSALFSSGPTEEHVATTTDQTPQWQQYATSTFSIEYPPGYTLNAAYAYDQFGPKKLIHGVSFTIPAQMATGTNLSSDTRVSVEQLPRAKKCTGDIFIDADVKTVTVTDGTVSYSLASTTDAAAGNRYEETVYALSGSSPCTAVRYFVHYGAIENYPQGTVQSFDRTQLMSEFDQIRQSLKLISNTQPASAQP